MKYIRLLILLFILNGCGTYRKTVTTECFDSNNKPYWVGKNLIVQAPDYRVTPHWVSMDNFGVLPPNFEVDIETFYPDKYYLLDKNLDKHLFRLKICLILSFLFFVAGLGLMLANFSLFGRERKPVDNVIDGLVISFYITLIGFLYYTFRVIVDFFKLRKYKKEQNINEPLQSKQVRGLLFVGLFLFFILLLILWFFSG